VTRSPNIPTSSYFSVSATADPGKFIVGAGVLSEDVGLENSKKLDTSHEFYF
jgi:hypothetical protein